MNGLVCVWLSNGLDGNSFKQFIEAASNFSLLYTECLTYNGLTEKKKLINFMVV